MNDPEIPETIAELLVAHRADPTAIITTIERTFARIAAASDPAIFISLTTREEAIATAKAIARSGNRAAPLFGIPVAIKDNIDVSGFETTAGCPTFGYRPEQDAAAVARLRAAGAIVIGKTNLDQFATGLVGVRTPYGVPRNALRADLVPGGSSSGSAVAVARGIVPLALGTDTAGSGRVPAGLNNIVGLKPSRGAIPTTGVVPACRSLDCVSIFALTVADASAALDVLSGQTVAALLATAAPHIGIPRMAEQRFGDAQAAAAFEIACERARSLGWQLIDVDLSAHFEAAALLYDGPWVAERTAAVGEFVAAHGDACHPVTRSIIAGGHRFTAVEVFRGLERLDELRRRAATATAGIDALMVPTMPGVCTLAEIAADPLAPNARLGTYTNFVNLLDLAAIAVPVSLTDDSTPSGVTLVGPSGNDRIICGLAAAIHHASGLTLGSLQSSSRLPMPMVSPGQSKGDRIDIAVVGAHMSGLPLNSELTSRGGRFVRAMTTTRDYRLFALTQTTPARPGLLRVADNSGSAIAGEVWSLEPTAFGTFVANVPAPLSIGTVLCDDGSSVKGFLVEAEAVRTAKDITYLGGWREFIRTVSP